REISAAAPGRSQSSLSCPLHLPLRKSAAGASNARTVREFIGAAQANINPPAPEARKRSAGERRRFPCQISDRLITAADMNVPNVAVGGDVAAERQVGGISRAVTQRPVG